MIKLYFYNGCRGSLDVEHELGITEDVDAFLLKQIPGLTPEGSDCAYDLDDNLILWFSAKDEAQCMQKIQDILKSHLSGQSLMQYTLHLTSDFSWYD